MGAIPELFRLDGRVSRARYAATGVTLMLVKYGVELGVIYAATGKLWRPLDYLVPVYTLRDEVLGGAPTWLFVALGLWTLPFVWIAAAMTMRRARDIGHSPWFVLLVFVPLVNHIAMLYCAARSGEPTHAKDDAEPGAALAHAAERREDCARTARSMVASAVLSVLSTAAIALVIAFLGAQLFESYGVALFFGLPFLAGLQAGYFFNRNEQRSVRNTLLLSALSVAVIGFGFLALALEGVVCLAMALPLALVPVVFGALFGRAIAHARAGLGGALLPAAVLPPLLWIEQKVVEPPTFEVVSSIEIDAPPERVWPNVTGFSEIPAPKHWIFATGIAYPMRARIEGEGVGALRHCEFSTGAFVEPITAWEPPARLAFDVRSQPLPMEEWSFYAHLRPPHLERSFRSLRGEFRLVPLDGGRTRLEGRTWYALDLAPHLYWRAWSDEIVHRIHGRVLEHIRALSEAR